MLDIKLKSNKSIAILGASGSIGTQALNICSLYGYKVHSLACHRNVEVLLPAIIKFHPKYVYVEDENYLKFLLLRFETDNFRKEYFASESKFWFREALPELFFEKKYLRKILYDDELDVVLAAISGFAGMQSCIWALESSKTLALANKEAMVTAAFILKDLAQINNTPIIPVDSEHAAIFQCLHAADQKFLKKIYLTASGGPFRTASYSDMEKAGIEDALAHPTWKMGAKISIDSATMVNKGLELIEAYHLFSVAQENIEIIVHPQSVIHSMIEWNDGSILAELGNSDMRRPILQALEYPQKTESLFETFNPFGPDNLGRKLEFFPLDNKKFAAVDLARFSLEKERLLPIIYNAVNEEAVRYFLQGRCKFTDIVKRIEAALDDRKLYYLPEAENLQDILVIDNESRLWFHNKFDS